MVQYVSDSIKYIGVDNLHLDKFENQYPLSHGMSYNSYVILDEKVAVTDTVDACCGDEWIAKLEEALGRRNPDYLIVHHMEPDHSANILRLMEKYPLMQLVASAKAISMIPKYFENADFTGRTVAVKEGDTLQLGAHTLRFISAPMVHWPEVMMSYEETDRVLFSADAFGKFGALEYVDEWIPEARRYYSNIVGKYGTQVQSVLKKCGSLAIDVIAPLHGPVLSGDLSAYFECYKLWSTYAPEKPDGVLVAYASIYGGTAKTALEFAGMLRSAGAGEVFTLDLCSCDVSEAVAMVFRYGRLALAAPTYDAGVFPAMHDFIYHMQIKNCRNRKVALIENGSWAPIAATVMRKMLSELNGIDVVEPHVTVSGRLHRSDMPALAKLAAALVAE